MLNSCLILPTEKDKFIELFKEVVQENLTNEIVEEYDKYLTKIPINELLCQKQIIINTNSHYEISPSINVIDNSYEIPLEIRKFISDCLQKTCNQIK